MIHSAPPPHQATHPGLALQWDLFCQVIDNFGDIGVCWRLARQLAERGQRVRLWVDDASALQWMAPEGCPGVELRRWGSAPDAARDPAPQVVVEAFGCEIPDPFLAWAVTQQQQQQSQSQPVWINLEYLSAEAYVERNHRLPSLVMSGPARGWTRWFFYPGFTPATGGLLREPGLAARGDALDRHAWRAQATAEGTPHAAQPRREGAARWVSLFCYEPPALAQWLQQLSAQRQPTTLLVAPGRPAAAVQAALASLRSTSSQIGLQSFGLADTLLSISYQPLRPQADFDDLLWACDFNAVRGEDSLMRALWAGQALVWHIYPQEDNAHHAKLHAFLDWLNAPATLRAFHTRWNGLDTQPLQWPDDATLAEWTACIRAARARLWAQVDLVSQLLGFVVEKR